MSSSPTLGLGLLLLPLALGLGEFPSPAGLGNVEADGAGEKIRYIAVASILTAGVKPETACNQTTRNNGFGARVGGLAPYPKHWGCVNFTLEERFWEPITSEGAGAVEKKDNAPT